jgi:tetratricopeptide (TPR) repeat protein
VYPKRPAIRLFLLIFFAFLSLPACTTARINPLLSQDPDGVVAPALLAQKQKRLEQLWNQRHLFDSVTLYIDLAEEISRTRQRDFPTMLRLARAYHLRGEYLQRDPKSRLVDWESGMNWAEKALTLNPEYRARVINLHLPPEHAMDSLKGDEIEALYWYAVNLGKWAALSGTSEILKTRGRVKKIIDYIAKVLPDLNSGAIYRYYGAYYALLPGYNRNDLEFSRKSFERAIERFPQYFTNRTLYAQVYAVKMKDAELFRNQLRWVEKARPDSVPEFYSEQLLEQKRATELLQTATLRDEK